MYPYSLRNFTDIRQDTHEQAKYIHWFCQNHMDTHTSNLKLFDFIDDDALKTRIAKELYVARYFCKLQFAFKPVWNQESFELFGCLKLQIVQYGGIFEAIIVYFLRKNIDHVAVRNKTKTPEYIHQEGALAKGVSIQQQDKKSGQIESLYLCKKKESYKNVELLRMEEKLEAAVEIGIISDQTKKSILNIYNLRNSVHIQKAAKNEIELEIDHCKNAFSTFWEFLEEIRKYLEYSETPEMKEEEERIKSEFEESINSLNQKNVTNSEIEMLVPGFESL